MLETDLTSPTSFPIFAVIFIVVGLAVILLAIILLLRRGSKKDIVAYEY